MSNQRFLYCRECNAVHHVTAFDTAPVFAVDSIEIREIPQDDRRSFLDAHFDHKIGDLISVDESRGEPSEFVDPMQVHYIEVTDGQEFFVIQASRGSITDPLRYEVLPRQLRLWDVLDGVGATLKNSPPQVSRGRYSRVRRPGRADWETAELPGIQ